MRSLVFCLVPTLSLLAACGSSEPCSYSDSAGFGTDCSLDENAQTVSLNEFTSTAEDYVELYNNSESQIAIGGWILTDDIQIAKLDLYDPALDVEKFVFPESTIIPALGYLAIPKGPSGVAHPFGISAKGDIISLVAANGELIDQAQALEGESKPSFCRIPDGTGEWQVCELTPGTANVALQCGNGVIDGSEECDGSNFGDTTCSELSPFYTGGSLGCSAACTFIRTECESSATCDAGTVLNEVCHKNKDCGVANVTVGDWFELYNNSESTIGISGCSIQVAKDGALVSKMRITHVPGFENLELEPGGYLLFDDIEELFDARNDSFVSLIGTNDEAINSMTASAALSTDGDVDSDTCPIDEGVSEPSPGSANLCQ